MSKDDILIKLHHTAIRTRDILTAIQFYSLFGFQVEAQFRSGPAKCCWLSLSNKYDAKIELIEIPSYILNEDLGTRKRALDSFRNEQLLGLNHMALDVSEAISNLRDSFNSTTTSSIRVESNSLSIKSYGLSEYLVHVNQTSIEKFGKGLRIALDPRQQIIGRYVFELAFLYDADGTVLELLNLIKVLDRVVDSGWEPWSREL
jgi:catechol 2,3-dioxygenase-like lactoylglutathione lyase family enzyme